MLLAEALMYHTETIYDQLPYTTHPFRNTHPDRLATIARLLGMKPASPDECRVLELACGDGSNLIAMADQLPTSQFVGIDLSHVHVERGRKEIDGLSLQNIRLSCDDIVNLPTGIGPFDYIIAHGIYSWTTEDVRHAILRACDDLLTPHGVAYISYNVLPGWRTRGAIRDMMRYCVRSLESPAEKIAASKVFMDCLVGTFQADAGSYASQLQYEWKQIRLVDESYMFHEYLEGVNRPQLFHEFVHQLREHELQYIADAQLYVPYLDMLSGPLAALIRSAANTCEDEEQYLDFALNRTFRHSLVCRSDVSLDRSPSADHLKDVYVASPCKAQRPYNAISGNDQAVSFRVSGAAIKSSNALIKAAMYRLGDQWPRSIAFSSLIDAARSDAGRGLSDSSLAGDARLLTDHILRCFSSRLVELSVVPSKFVPEVSERPVALHLARYKACQGDIVTNSRHEPVTLNDLQRKLLPLMDGSRGKAELVASLVEMVHCGSLHLYESGRTIKDTTRLRNVLSVAVEGAIRQLAMSGLLIG